MNIMNSRTVGGRSAEFLNRIVTNQTDKRRAVNEAVGRVLTAYLPTAYDDQLMEQIDWLLDSMLLELGEQPGVEAAEGMVRGGRALVVTGQAGAGKSRALAHAFASRPEFHGFGKPGEWSPLLSVVAPFSDHAEAVQETIRNLVALCPLIGCEDLQSAEFAHRLLHAATYQFGIVVEYVQDAIAECLMVEGGGELGLGHFADVYAIRTGVRNDELNPFVADDWTAIPVEAALYEDVLDETGKPTGARKPKRRSTKGARK